MDIIKEIESTPVLLTKIVEGWEQHQSPSFDELAQSVLQTHQTAQSGAIRAVNQMATLRNWLIGCYIVEYEQRGSDRAKYGERLLKRLEERVNTKGLNETLFLAARRFYSFYPQIGELFELRIRPTVSDKLIVPSSISATLSPKSVGEIQNPPYRSGFWQ